MAVSNVSSFQSYAELVSGPSDCDIWWVSVLADYKTKQFPGKE